jgi:shikimate dehydrogenase
MAPELSARTRLTAIYGDPVEHSLSPVMHNAAYSAPQMDRAYVAFRVTPERLHDALQAIVTLGMLGVNLTLPHKERAAKMADSISDEARLLQSVNCIVNRDGSLYGENTDARGLEMDLRANHIDIAGRTVLIAGAGGAASAAALACLRMRPRRIIIANRTPQKATVLAGRFAELWPKAEILAEPLGILREGDRIREAALIINATSAGLKGEEFEVNYQAVSPQCVFYDLIYAREATPFLKPARAISRRSYDGAGMLAGQGELAFELFNGAPAPSGVMREALMKSLGRSSQADKGR